MKQTVKLSETYNGTQGAIEIIIRNRQGQVVDKFYQKNQIKVSAKEILAHRLAHSKVWDPNSSSGLGAWVPSGIDPNEDFSAKYILFGASYVDATGEPLDTNDPRYYTLDTTTNTYLPVRPNVGADNGGDLIHPIPISEPNRPLKRIENISFQPSYQPADSPLLDDTVRAMNNVLILETTLKLDEYNGFAKTPSDFFTITEVALAGGKEIDTIGTCECPPATLFLEGAGGVNDESIHCVANGTATISINSNVLSDDVNRISQGDQILITSQSTDGTENQNTLQQVQPYYLVVSKAIGGRDITLDRTPQVNGVPLTGPIGIYRSSLRIFSQRILSYPFKKSSDFEITVRWLLYFN